MEYKEKIISVICFIIIMLFISLIFITVDNIPEKISDIIKNNTEILGDIDIFTVLISIIIIILYFILLFGILSKKSIISKENAANEYDKYSINDFKNQLYHYNIVINKDNMNKDEYSYFKIIKSGLSIDDTDYDFKIEYNNNYISVYVNTINPNRNSNTVLYDYEDQNENIFFEYNNYINTNTDLIIDLILDNNIIHLIINNKIVKSREMDYGFSDKYDTIFSTMNIIDSIELYDEIDNSKLKLDN